MIILEDVNFICKYRYDGCDDEYTMESSSVKYLKRKMSEFTDCGKDVYYKIYTVIEEGCEETYTDDE